MPTAEWQLLPEQLDVSTDAGYVLDRPSAAELDATMSDYEARAGFRLPATYREFLHRFGPGELAGYFRISGPIPARFRGQVAEAFDIDAQRAMLADPEGYWAEVVAPTLTRRLVLFAETIGGDWLFWDIDDVRYAGYEYGVYGFSRGDRHRGELVADSFAAFITDVCLGRGFPVYPQHPWEAEWVFRPGWPVR